MSYVNPKLELRQCGNPSLGKALFARERITKGQVLVRHEGVIVSNSALATVPPETLLHWCYDADDDYTFCPRDFKHPSLDWFFNHSCDPNMGAGGNVSVQVAMRDIEAGEEITVDYAMIDSDPDWAMEYYCNARACRGVVTGNDWMLPELQERYRGYFQRNIQEKVDALRRGNLTR